MGALNPTHKSTLRFRPLRRIQCRCGNKNYLRCNIAIVNESSKGGVSQKSLYFLFYLLSKWSLLLLSAEEMKLSGLRRQNSFKTTVKTLERTAALVFFWIQFFLLSCSMESTTSNTIDTKRRIKICRNDNDHRCKNLLKSDYLIDSVVLAVRHSVSMRASLWLEIKRGIVGSFNRPVHFQKNRIPTKNRLSGFTKIRKNLKKYEFI
jgi:hypothetical protein